MKAGKLRHLVSIERATKTRGGYGEEIETFLEIGKAWASIDTMTGAESTQGGQSDAKSNSTIIMRYTSINNSDRINFGGRIFNIIHIDNKEGRNKELQITAIEDV